MATKKILHLAQSQATEWPAPTPTAWTAYAKSIGLVCLTMPNGKGCLKWTARGWTLLYSRDISPELQVLVIAHEISEYLTRREQTRMFTDEIAIAFDGVADEAHKVAVEYSRMVAKAYGWIYADVTRPKVYTGADAKGCAWGYRSRAVELQSVDEPFDDDPEAPLPI